MLRSFFPYWPINYFSLGDLIGPRRERCELDVMGRIGSPLRPPGSKHINLALTAALWFVRFITLIIHTKHTQSNTLEMDQKGEAKQDRRSDSKMEEPHLSLRLKEHYEKEAEILRLLLNLENRFREYYKIFICEMKAQRILIERIWLLTQRYLILISSEQGCRYPEVYTLSTEEAIVNEYEEKLEVIRASK